MSGASREPEASRGSGTAAEPAHCAAALHPGCILTNKTQLQAICGATMQALRRHSTAQRGAGMAAWPATPWDAFEKFHTGQNDYSMRLFVRSFAASRFAEGPTSSRPRLLSTHHSKSERGEKGEGEGKRIRKSGRSSRHKTRTNANNSLPSPPAQNTTKCSSAAQPPPRARCTGHRLCAPLCQWHPGAA
jgi:hypothetical protein